MLVGSVVADVEEAFVVEVSGVAGAEVGHRGTVSRPGLDQVSVWGRPVPSLTTAWWWPSWWRRRWQKIGVPDGCGCLHWSFRAWVLEIWPMTKTAASMMRMASAGMGLSSRFPVGGGSAFHPTDGPADEVAADRPEQGTEGNADVAGNPHQTYSRPLPSAWRAMCSFGCPSSREQRISAPDFSP